MNLVTVFIVFILNIRSEDNSFEINRIFCLRNNICDIDHNLLKGEMEHSSEIYIYLEFDNVLIDQLSCNYKSYHLIDYTKFGYIVLNDFMIDYIIALFKSPEDTKFSLRIYHAFGNSKDKEGTKQVCTTYNLPDLPTIKKSKEILRNNISFRLGNNISFKLGNNISLKLGNNISFKCDLSTDTRKQHIKRMFEELLCKKVLNLNDFIKNINEKRKQMGITSKVEEDADFKLNYFETYFECFRNLNKFIEDFFYFKLKIKLMDEEASKPSNAESFNDKLDLKISLYVKSFRKKSTEKIEDLYGNETDKDWIAVLDENFDYLNKKMLRMYVFFLFGDKYNIDFCIDNLYNLVFKSIKDLQQAYNSPDTKAKASSEMHAILKLNLRNVLLGALKELCDFEFIPKHFSKLLGKEVKESDFYIEIEKIMCDYRNMFIYIRNLYNKINNNTSVSCPNVPPLSNENYNLTVIDAIKVKFIKDNKFVNIQGFDDKRKQILMREGTDYFFDECGMLYCPSDVLKGKNIEEIQVVSEDCTKKYKSSRIFKVIDYLLIS